MNILQITNDFAGSKVYMNLFSSLDKLNVCQKVYTAVRSEDQIGKNNFIFKTDSSTIEYSHILNLQTRINYNHKIKKIVKDIETKVSLGDVDLMHAHTWFSDGGAAYELHKKTGKPYVVTVRNTDVNIFFKYLIHLRKHGLKILENAERIILISPLYSKRLFGLSLIAGNPKLVEKSIVIPNGVDSYWISNANKKIEKRNNELSLLYIGKFSRVKNVSKLLKAVELLNLKGVRCELNLVGGGGSLEKKIFNYIRGKSYFKYHGRIDDKIKLQELFNASDIFTMPSKSETFGLVYIEALSQGVPVIYTKNEGIDGFYGDRIGVAVDSNKIKSIAEGIELIHKNYSLYDFDPNDIVKNHNWDLIAKRYRNLYSNSILEGNLSLR